MLFGGPQFFLLLFVFVLNRQEILRLSQKSPEVFVFDAVEAERTFI